MLKIKSFLFAGIILGLALMGCTRSLSTAPAPLMPTALTSPTTTTAAAASSTPPAVGVTQVSPTKKPPKPTTPPKPTATSAPLKKPAADAQTVQVFLIAVDDGGKSGKKIGCGDSAVPVNVAIQPSLAVLRASYDKLLSMKSQYYGESGLYNALYQSNLKVEGLALNNGEAVIHLRGKMAMGGECDSPRVQAQLEETALQFSTVHNVVIYINDKLLKDALSLK